MRSSSSVTVGKIARTSSLWATYSPHWTGTPISLRLSTRRTLRPRRAAYRAAVAPAGPEPAPITSQGGGIAAPPPYTREETEPTHRAPPPFASLSGRRAGGLFPPWATADPPPRG